MPRKKLTDIQLVVIIANLLGVIQGRKRFQKIIFLLKHFYNIPLRYDFMPYLYGPYCPELQNHIDILVSEGILDVGRNNGLYVYEITQLGQGAGKASEKNLTSIQKRKIKVSLKELSSKGTNDLVKHSKRLMKKLRV